MPPQAFRRYLQHVFACPSPLPNALLPRRLPACSPTLPHTTTERKVCFRNDCDALFTPPDLRRRQREWPAGPCPQLIITAGPERSGSTWLYNAGWCAACCAVPCRAVLLCCAAVLRCAVLCCAVVACCAHTSAAALQVCVLSCCPATCSPCLPRSRCPLPQPAVRLLFQHACQPLDAYWVRDVTDAALDARGVGGRVAARRGRCCHWVPGAWGQLVSI